LADELSGPAGRAWVAVRNGGWQLMAKVDDALEANGVKLVEYRILEYIAETTGGKLPMCDLAAGIGLSRPTLSYHTKNMLEAGLVAVTQSQRDMRHKHAELTPAGRKLLKKARVAYADRVRSFFLDVMAPEELATVTEVFERMYKRP
jgi:DNA-binding MarR family transcriptional regulator